MLNFLANFLVAFGLGSLWYATTVILIACGELSVQYRAPRWRVAGIWISAGCTLLMALIVYLGYFR